MCQTVPISQYAYIYLYSIFHSNSQPQDNDFCQHHFSKYEMLQLPFDLRLKIVFIHRSELASRQTPDEMIMFDADEAEVHQSPPNR